MCVGPREVVVQVGEVEGVVAVGSEAVRVGGLRGALLGRVRRRGLVLVAERGGVGLFFGGFDGREGRVVLLISLPLFF